MRPDQPRFTANRYSSALIADACPIGILLVAVSVPETEWHLQNRGKVLVLSDTLDLRGEVVNYALELALRTDSSLSVLIIHPLGQGGDGPDEVESAVVERLSPPLEAARTAGVGLEAMVKRGVPSSEVMKFLAESSTVHTIVWGGERSLALEKMRNKKSHWLAQIRDTLPCPVVIPLPKSVNDKPL